MVDTTNKPYEVYFNGKKYRLLSGGRYYLSQSNTNAGRRNAKSLHVAIWEYYNQKTVPADCCIHHKDGNTFNNSIENLECVNAKEHLSEHGKKNWENKDFRKKCEANLNSVRYMATAWHKSKEGLAWHQKQKENYSKKIVQYDLFGNEVARFGSMKEASDKTGISYSSITKCAAGKIRTGGNYIWKYAESAQE